MQLRAVVLLCVFTVWFKTAKCELNLTDETQLKDYILGEYEEQTSQLQTKYNLAQWDYNVDVNNKEKEEAATQATLEIAEYSKKVWEEKFKDLNEDNYETEFIKRQLRLMKDIGSAILDNDDIKNLTEISNELTNIYSTGKICPYKNQNCSLDKEGLPLTPDIEDIFLKSRDYDELAYVWKAWRDASGAKMPKLYAQYVELNNKAARLNGFKDYGESWRDSYETPNFEEDIDAIWAQIEPFYNELHKYTANKLKTLYGDKINTTDGNLPAHVFGNVWAQSWGGLSELLKPYPNASKVDVTAALTKQNYTVLEMFEMADTFYKSMGLLPNDICYNTSQGAMIEKPTDGREVVCHASAWDFSNGKDYRIKMCTQITDTDFTTIHHEMGHIQYFQQYAKQAVNFRTGANPGFHEAIGDTIALSVNTPAHLKKIALLPDDYVPSEESSINALMDMALEKVAFLPFGLLVDKWRWDVFSGKVTQEEWNSQWWLYRAKYQKLKPPVERSDSDFDPGAKFHVPADSQYIAYFVAHILQFQFYKSFCIAAGEYNPDDSSKALHECDFYESTAAGQKLALGLRLGASKHWSFVLEQMTGETKLNASALLEYFQPLYDFLKESNARL